MKERFLLDPDVVYLNHGSFGACPRPVFEAYQRIQRELERRFPELLDEARRALAAFVGADPPNLVFAPSATVALNAVARSLPLGPGDEVLLGDAEYGGMERLWDFVARRSGATIVRRPFAELAPGDRTRVVFCSHVEWSTGRVNELEPLAERTRASGALLVVDGAHAPGQLDLELERIGADVYVGNCHKWLCAPKGSAFLWADPAAQPLIDPPVVSWDWRDDAPFHERHRWQGTRDPSAYLAVPAAIAFQTEHDWTRVRSRCHDLLAALELPFEPLADDFVQMRGFRVDHPDPPALKHTLYERHRIEVPVFETPAGWVMRVSVQAYNDGADLAALERAVSES